MILGQMQKKVYEEYGIRMIDNVNEKKNTML